MACNVAGSMTRFSSWTNVGIGQEVAQIRWRFLVLSGSWFTATILVVFALTRRGELFLVEMDRQCGCFRGYRRWQSRSRLIRRVGAISSIRIRVVLLRVEDDGVMKDVGETNKWFGIYILVAGQVTGGLFTYLVCNAVNEDLVVVNRPVRDTAAVESWKNIIGKVGCAFVGELPNVLYRILRLNYLFFTCVLAR